MTIGIAETSPNKVARIAGSLYGPLMLPLGLFGLMYVPTVLVVAGDAVTTTKNIMANIGLFRLSIATAIIVQVAHIFIVLLLYITQTGKQEPCFAYGYIYAGRYPYHDAQ